jgi:squalene cyclase
MEAGMKWLSQFEPRFTEERVFQLLAMHWTGKETVGERARQLLAEQRQDGGWAQLGTLESDAYATGQAMYALLESGMLRPKDEACARGVQYLLRTQARDGSWLVKSRTIKFQPHLEAGFPYGKHQFISAAGTSWAAMALMMGTR